LCVKIAEVVRGSKPNRNIGGDASLYCSEALFSDWSSYEILSCVPLHSVFSVIQNTSSGKPCLVLLWIAGIEFPVGVGTYLFAKSRPGLGPTQSPIQWVQGVLSLEVKRPGRKADDSPPSSAEVKKHGAIPPFPLRLHGIVLS